MEETLTLARVIENINYVYGEKLVKALFLFVLLEIVALVFITKKKPEWMKYLKMVVLCVATMFSLMMLFRSRIQEGYRKIELNDTTCAFQEVYDAHGEEHRTMVDTQIYDWHYSEKYDEMPDTYEQFDLTVACTESAGRNFIQMLACSVIFLMGFFAVRCALGGRYENLSFALAAPFGASILVAITLLLIVLNIPYNRVSIFIFIALIIGLVAWITVKKQLSIKKTSVIYIITGLATIVASTILKFYRLAGDARWQVLYARDLAHYHHLQEPFFSVTTYGFFGISLHAFGTLFNVDMLYAYFLLIGLSAIATVIAVTSILLEGKRKMMTYPFLGMGILLLITNFDYLYYLEWILSNCAVGVCLLAIMALTYLNIKKGTEVTSLIALFSFVVITTRIEGVCYVVLLLSIPFVRTGSLKKVNVIVGGEVIGWQVVQAFLSTGVGQDGWTPLKGVALSMAGLLLILEPYIIKVDLFKKIMKHYNVVYAILLICIIGLGLAYDRTMAIDNIIIFLSHFTVSKNSNSLAFWSFVVLLFPLAIYYGNKEKDNCMTAFILYILMAFGISIFRTGNPLHTGTSDSFRRILYQIMPLALWTVTYYAGGDSE